MFNLQLEDADVHPQHECSSLGNVFNLQLGRMLATRHAKCSSLGNVFNLQRVDRHAQKIGAGTSLQLLVLAAPHISDACKSRLG